VPVGSGLQMRRSVVGGLPRWIWRGRCLPSGLGFWRSGRLQRSFHLNRQWPSTSLFLSNFTALALGVFRR